VALSEVGKIISFSCLSRRIANLGMMRTATKVATLKTPIIKQEERFNRRCFMGKECLVTNFNEENTS
jgi:hypothetical protein